MSKIIDGKKISGEIKEELKEKVSKLKVKPSLVVISVGDNEASIQKLLSLRQKLQELETRKPKDYDVNEEDGFTKFLRFSRKHELCSGPIDYQFW